MLQVSLDLYHRSLIRWCPSSKKPHRCSCRERYCALILMIGKRLQKFKEPIRRQARCLRHAERFGSLQRGKGRGGLSRCTRDGGHKEQNLQSSRQNSQSSQQIDRSFLSLGNKPFRLKLSRCCSCSGQSGSAPEDPYELWSYLRCDVCWLSITHV